MALNVTTAVFRPGFNIATASPSLVQWDQGQTLQFEGVELPSAYQVEFTNAVTVQAITMIGNENGVEIPNELLQQSFPITAYIVLHETAEDRETEYWATIYVKARQKPREETPDPEQSSVIDQTIAALQEGVAEAQAASQAVQNMGVEAETLPEGSEATVEKTVDPETGEVTLEFGIPEGRHGATGATPDIQIGTVTTGAPGSQADASITGTREEPRLNLTIPQGPQGDAGVTSVNGKTGAVTLNATDVGAKPASYEAPVSSINGKTGAVVLDASDVGAKPASYEAPVSSVNGKTGAVVLSASDVGAKPASYEAPVSSVNEKTGAVVLDSEDIRYDSTETYSDGTVGKELGTINSALSSLSAVTEIIDTASGAIASFPDGSGLPMRSLVAEINPVQDLHGQDAPYPAGGGKNKLNPESWVLRTTNGITFTRDGNDIVCNGTATATAYLNLTQFTYTASVAFNRIQIYATSSATVSGVTLQIQRKSGSSTIGTLNLAITGATNETGGNIDSTTTQEIAGYIAVSNGVTLNNVHFGIAVYFDDSSATTHAYYPYSNICPISGWTGLEGQRTGKNILANDTVTKVGNNYFIGGISASDYPHFLKAGTYTLSNSGSSAWAYCKEQNGADSVIHNGSTLSGSITLTKDGYYKLWFYTTDADVSFTNIQLELGSTASPYEEYTGEAISVSFPSTVYGGTDEVVSGNGTSTMVTTTLSSFNWSIGFGGFYYPSFASIAKRFSSEIPTFLCDRLKTVAYADAKTSDGRISQVYSGESYPYNGYLFVYDTSCTTIDEFLAKYGQAQFVYELATHTTFTHTGQSVDTLVGQNNVFVDTGDVSVTYQANLKGYIDKVLAQ